MSEGCLRAAFSFCPAAIAQSRYDGAGEDPHFSTEDDLASAADLKFLQPLPQARPGTQIEKRHWKV
jgi:hypothetical protein